MRQNEIFNTEVKRQTEAIGRITKIKVQYKGQPKDATFIMNRYLSTPYNCAQRKYIYINGKSLTFFYDRNFDFMIQIWWTCW